MRKPPSPLHHFHGHIKRPMIIVIIPLVFFSCSQNRVVEQAMRTKKDSLKLPVTISGKLPVLVMLDTCPAPRKVIIPAKPGGYSLRKSDMGMQRIQSLPPEINPAGLFVPMQNFNTEQGLALGSILTICEDKNGNLWFGTAGGGVSRYDGKSFTNFSVAQGLANNYVMDIYPDRSGNLWFGAAEGGVTCYDGKTFTVYSVDQGLAADLVNKIIEDKNGILWFATQRGLSRFDPGSKTFKNFTIANGLPYERPLTILQDRQGNYWIGYWGGLSKMSPDGKTFTVYPAMSGISVGSMLEDKEGNLFFGCYDGVRYLAKEELSKPPELAHFNELTIEKGLLSSIIQNMIQDRNGKIWLSTSKALSCFDPLTMDLKNEIPVFTHFTTGQGLTNDEVYFIYEDRKGNLWAGTNGGGVSLMDQAGRVISTFTTKQGLEEDQVFCIVEDKNKNTWFGTEGGLSRLDSSEKSFTGFTTAQGLVDYWTFSIREDKKGNIWFCTQGDGVSMMDRDYKTITTWSTEHGLPHSIVSYILEDKNGNIWLATAMGISRFDGKSITNYSMTEGLAGNQVNEIILNRDGDLWLATDGGISKLDLQGNPGPGAPIPITSYTMEHGLAFNSVKTIFEDRSGVLWIGTYGKGCDRYDGKTFLNLSSADGLPDEVISDIGQDNEGNIWLGSGKGVTQVKGFLKYDAKEVAPGENKLEAPGKFSNEEIVKGGYKAVFENYNIATGYPIKDLYGASMHISSKNILWVGTGQNVVRFDYRKVQKDPNPPGVFIQNLKVNNEKIAWYHLSPSADGKEKQATDSNTISAGITEEVTLFGKRMNEAQRDIMQKKFGDIKFDSITRYYPLPLNLVLPYGHNNVTFEFAAIETTRPGLVKYQYMLEGYDIDWNPPGTASSASFGNIHEGNYTFKLRARSPDGIWSEPLLYRFKVLAPWYRSWWAYAIYMLGFIILVWSLIRWRVDALKKEKIVLEKGIADRTSELRKEKEKVETTLTELKSTQDQLIQSAKMASLGELTAGIAHEIQNPLNFVNNFSEINKELLVEMKDEIDKGNLTEVKTIANDVIDNEEKINHHGKRAEAIVKGMLQHSRSSSRVKEPTDINKLADEYLRLAYHGLRAKDKSFNTTLETDFDERIGNISIIPQDIGRVILNLINNAFYAVTEKTKQAGTNYEPKVSVSSKKLNDNVEIRVRDNGIGIPQKVVDKIFQPFFTTKPTGQGTGLGLSLSYDIIKAHSGELKVETTEGEGAEFIINLPN